MGDREATQKFAVEGVLIRYCGQNLTPNKIDEIVNAIGAVMDKGSTSWAFKHGGWINVNDELPHEGQEVDVWTWLGRTTDYKFFDGKFQWFHDGYKSWTAVSTVQFWMPKPDPPTKE